MSVLKRYNDVTGLWEPVVVGKQGPSGVVNVTAPITNTGTQTDANIGIDESAITVAQSQVTDLVSDLADKADNADFTGGTAGYTALSNGTAGLSYQPVSHNYIINGAMDFDQRGGPHAFGGRTYTLDRWAAGRSGSVSGATVTQVSSGLANIPNALRLQRDSGNTSTADISLQQNFENAGLELAGKEVSFSFYARAGANNSGRLTPRMQTSTSSPESQGYVSDGRFNSGTTDFAVNIFTPSTSWTRYTYTFTVSSNANAMQIEFDKNSMSGTAGADDWIEITGVQLEAGSIATPFKRNANSIQGELAACQRYYYSALTSGLIFRYYNMRSSTGGVSGHYQLPVTMRANPSVSLTTDISDGAATVPSNAFATNAKDIFFAQNGVVSLAYVDLRTVEASAEL